MPHRHWLRRKPREGPVGLKEVLSSLPSANTGNAVDGPGNPSVLLPSTLPVRIAGNLNAPSVISTRSQDLDANIPGSGSADPADDTPEDLWDRAYTALRGREDLKKLMDTYENVLLENLQGEGLSPGTLASLKASDREQQMSALVRKKVDHMEQAQSKLPLGNKHIKLRPQVDRVVKAVIYAKDFVTSAASADPHAALAWAGVCVFLPLLLNPTKQHEALEEGLGYISDLVCRFNVIDRMYVKQKVSRPNCSCPEDIKRLRQRFEVKVTTLYSQILEYQARVVCHPDHKLVKLGRDMVAADGWDKLLVEIKKSEVSCGDFSQVLDNERLDQAFKEQNSHMEVLLQAQDKGFKEVAEAIVARSEEHRTDEESKCHIVFRTSEYEAQKDRNPNRVDGTCNWFLQHSVYKNWRDEDKDSLLWVSADPGCGKSVLSRSLIDNEFHDMKSYTVCYFFFKDDNEDQKSAKNALCSMLHQFFAKKPHLLRHSLPEFRQNGDKLPGLFDRLWSIFTSIAADPEAGRIICVLDALDECRASDRVNLVDKLNQLYQHTTENGKKSTLKFLITSRPYRTIESDFDPSTIRLAGEEESESIRREIDLVIKDKVPAIASKLRVKNQAWFQPYLEQKLTSMPHRTYLWLHLILEVITLRQDRLRAGVTKKNLEAVIDLLPETVEDAYTDILEKSPDKDGAKKLLHIVVAAQRPLTLEEMNIAMNVDDKSRSYEDLILEPDDNFRTTIRDYCGLFVSIVDSKIYLIHQTAKEFLITKANTAESSTDVQSPSGFGKHSLEPGKSNFVLANICISYLLFSVFEEAPLILHKDEPYGKNEEIARLYYEEHKFLDYSSQYWTTHFREAVSSNEALSNKALDICGTGTKRLQTWLTIALGNKYISLIDLTVASYFGLVPLVQLLLNKRTDLSDKDEQGRIALHWAADQGHESVTRLLLNSETDPSATTKKGWTALHFAARSGHESVTRLLLDRGAYLSAADKIGQTALHSAAERGHKSVVRLLLNKGANPSATNILGKTALDRARDMQAMLEGDRYDAVIQLLEPITKPTATKSSSSSPSTSVSSSVHSLSKPSHVDSD